MKVLKSLHTAYAFLIFFTTFFIFYALLMVPIVIPKQHQLVGVFNRWWAKTFFILTFFPYKTEYRCHIDKNQPVIFCPNHFSYLDIPAMGLNRYNSIFVGKSDMGNIPLFGYMYRKLHITVNRQSLKSRYQTLIRSKEAIDAGKKLTIFPEGGIVSKNPPAMGKFKEGAFRTAIEKQIPIIPVTIPNNWIILPDSKWLPTIKTVKVIFHEEIETKGLTIADLEDLKQKTFDVISEELKTTFSIS